MSDSSDHLKSGDAPLAAESQQVQRSRQPPPHWLAISRATALFLGCFALLNVIGELFHPGFDANELWIDLRPLSAAAARGVLALAAACLIFFGLRPATEGLLRRVIQFILVGLLAVSLANVVTYWGNLQNNEFRTTFPIPFAAQVSCLLGIVLAGAISPVSRNSISPQDGFLMGLTLLLCIGGFPVAQLYCVGKIDQRCEADVVVVFGCRVYHDGTASPSLDSRVRTASRLITDGLADVLIVSGGPGDGAIHESDTMKRLAIEYGVDPGQIVMDDQGFNTRSTVGNTVQLMRQRGWKSVLAVSDFYHLPRIALTFRRVQQPVSTVPADAEPMDLPFQLVRESAAWWFYYLQPR